MVKITNGRDVFDVTTGAYETIFKQQGFIPYKGDDNAANGFMGGPAVAPAVEEDSMTADERFVQEISEKPISNWNKEEVRRFAHIKGVDLTGTKNVGEAKERIKPLLV